MSAMATESGRGPKDSRRRSSKQLSKSSASSSSHSRPKSDVKPSQSKSSRHSAPAPAPRPALQDRTCSEPAERPDARSPSLVSALNVPSAQSKTFLLRPSIDQPADSTRRSSTANDDDDDGDEQDEEDDDGAAGDDDQDDGDVGSVRTATTVTRKRSVVRVVGAAGSGKSTFVNQYLDTRNDGGASRRTPRNQIPHADVVFQELALDDVKVLDDGRIKWPAPRLEQKGQNLGGVVVLYDVMNRASLSGVQKIIKALSDASTPTALVASKCDFPSNERALDPEVIEENVKSHFEDVHVFRISRRAVDSPRACVSSLLDENATPLATSPARSVVANSDKRPPSNTSSRDSSSKVASMSASTERSDPGFAGPTSLTTPQRRSKSQTQLQVQTSMAVRERAAGDRSPNSFLDLEESPRPDFGTKRDGAEELDLDDRDPNLERERTTTPADSALTFDELTAKLLYPSNTSKVDDRFIATFLTFYRFFAPPLSVLDAIIKHFDAHDGNVISPWVHEPILERDLGIIDRWLHAFPGDFAKFEIRHKLRKFLARIERDHGVVGDTRPTDWNDSGTLVETYGEAATLAASASNSLLALDLVGEDDDTDWACSDAGPLRRSRTNTFLSISSLDSQAGHGPSDPEEPVSKVTTTSNPAYDAKLIFGGQSTLTLNAMGRSRPNPDSGSSSQTLLNIAESAQRQAALLSPKPTQPFGKSQWRLFVSYPDDLIAKELTRIDWIMFSSIRPRDLIRHITTSALDRGRLHSLENVSRMIDHFNHLAYWVTNVVLFRDKPKHRAQALEKFMRVARKLRELNNYNALGAIVAGIQGTAVHRLKATKDLVNPAVQKDFMKLEILMAATKGHWAYRLAWENTSTQRVPFLPLHRRDLVVAEAGGKTFVGEDKKPTSTSSPTGQETLSTASDPDLPNEKVRDGDASKSSSSSSKTTPTSTSTTPTPTSTSTRRPSGPAAAAAVAAAAAAPARINWRKFAIMGEVLDKLIQAQAVPYHGFSANEDVRSLVLDHVIVKDDDDLYERSTALESPSSGAVGGGGDADPGMRKKVIDRIGALVG